MVNLSTSAKDQIKDKAVYNPSHYNQGKVEVIDIIEDAVKGAEPFEAVCLANVLKYMLRYRYKNGVQDIEKSLWYTNKLLSEVKRQAKDKTNDSPIE
jgi:hypothetical protein